MVGLVLPHTECLGTEYEYSVCLRVFVTGIELTLNREWKISSIPTGRGRDYRTGIYILIAPSGPVLAGWHFVCTSPKSKKVLVALQSVPYTYLHPSCLPGLFVPTYATKQPNQRYHSFVSTGEPSCQNVTLCLCQCISTVACRGIADTLRIKDLLESLAGHQETAGK